MNQDDNINNYREQSMGAAALFFGLIIMALIFFRAMSGITLPEDANSISKGGPGAENSLQVSRLN